MPDDRDASGDPAPDRRPRPGKQAAGVPSPLKWAYLLFVLLLVPTYTWWHGLANFLWFSNVALLGGLAGVWLESRRVLSTQAVSVSLLEMFWIFGFFVGLARGGEPPFGITEYMFDATIPLFVRILSLYHLVLPFVLWWLIWRLGYDDKAWRWWAPIGCGIMLVTYFVSQPDRNVNWTYGPGGEPQDFMPEWAWLILAMAGGVAVWWVTHRVILLVFKVLPKPRG